MSHSCSKYKACFLPILLAITLLHLSPSIAGKRKALATLESAVNSAPPWTPRLRKERKHHFTPESAQSAASNVSEYVDDAALAGPSFPDFLKKQDIKTHQRYTRHKNSQPESKWRKALRQQYMEERLEEWKQDVPHLSRVCLSLKRPANVEALALDLNIKAAQAFPEEAFPNTPLSNLGTHRHLFCEQYMKAIKEHCQNIIENLPCKRNLWAGMEIEPAYLDGHPVPIGTKGSVQPDLYLPKQGWVFDHKNFDAGIKPEDLENWRRNLPHFKHAVEIKADS